MVGPLSLMQLPKDEPFRTGGWFASAQNGRSGLLATNDSANCIAELFALQPGLGDQKEGPVAGEKI